MIHHSKGLDLEISGFEYHHNRTRRSEIIPSHTSKYAMRDGVEHPTCFVEACRKKAKVEELSNNISERQCELKANAPVSERSEQVRGYIVGYISKEPSGELLVYPQYSILLL